MSPVESAKCLMSIISYQIKTQGVSKVQYIDSAVGCVDNKSAGSSVYNF